MKDKEIQEGLGELADMAERDHEVQMARADLYKIAKYAIKLHDMMKKVSESEGLEGWVQSKITKAADYLGSVYHHLDYEDATGELGEARDTHCSDKCCGSDVKAEDCTCSPDCPHCNCNAVNEGKFKSDAHRKAVHAGKASGKRSKKKLRDHSDLTNRLAAKLESKKKIAERSLSTGEEKKKEKYVKGMKKAKGDFKDRYGDDAEAVMYATATKMAKEDMFDYESKYKRGPKSDDLRKMSDPWEDKVKKDMEAGKDASWFLDKKKGAGQKWAVGTPTYFDVKKYQAKRSPMSKLKRAIGMK